MQLELGSLSHARKEDWNVGRWLVAGLMEMDQINKEEKKYNSLHTINET